MTTAIINRLNGFGYKKTYESNDESHYELRKNGNFVDVHIDEKEVKFRRKTIKPLSNGSEFIVKTLKIPHKETKKIMSYIHALNIFLSK